MLTQPAIASPVITLAHKESATNEASLYKLRLRCTGFPAGVTMALS